LKFVRIFRLSFVIVPNFFSENLSKTLTNKTKKELRIAIVRILSYGLEFIQKSTFSFPRIILSNLVFSDFSPNLPDFFFLLKTFNSVISSPGHIKQKKELIKYVVPIVSLLRSKMHTKIITFAIFQFSGQLFQFFFSF
jgi:hypothetical protein